MPSKKNDSEPVPLSAREFATTHWSVVLLAGAEQNTRAQLALSSLCQAYWYPLYAYVRRQGHSPHDAEDLTQEFFARLIEKNYVAAAQRERGRFRYFLLASLKHFLANEWDRARALKRGGGKPAISLDAEAAEGRYALEPVDRMSADRIFERRWATTLLDRVLDQLRGQFVAENKTALFDEVKGCLAGSGRSVPYAELGARIGMTEGAVKVYVHRLRQRYRGLLRQEIAETVASPEEVEDELRYLFKVLND